jgi:hypothetical protein
MGIAGLGLSRISGGRRPVLMGIGVVLVAAAAVGCTGNSRTATAAASATPRDPYLRWCADVSWTDAVTNVYLDAYALDLRTIKSIPPSEVAAAMDDKGKIWTDYQGAVALHKMPPGINHAEMKAYVVAVADAAFNHDVEPGDFAAAVKTHCQTQADSN